MPLERYASGPGESVLFDLENTGDGVNCAPGQTWFEEREVSSL